jgi:hypothetical protein
MGLGGGVSEYCAFSELHPAFAHLHQHSAQAVERAFPRPRDEAVVSKAKDRADSPSRRALGRQGTGPDTER